MGVRNRSVDDFSSFVPAKNDGVEVNVTFIPVAADSFKVLYRDLVIGHCIRRLITRPWRFRSTPSHEFSSRQLLEIARWLRDKNEQEPPV